MVVVDVVLEGVGSVGQRYPGAENLRPMLAGGMICNRGKKKSWYRICKITTVQEIVHFLKITVTKI